ncbi:hypothetical protein APR12_006034 [Nocardia amikacinitolerans]|uniref:hypothetical protein n=1 Tax=Nocardia amikacinitolerans TaxID=756689 RepID=UPI00082E0749|nr:hypothetical protein [Nocardia amikacinitolerans]MCP2320651.1 hypothetical protein [Nocardia amikacinitolerans]
MSGENASGAEQSWPDRWRWDEKRARDYERRGWAGVWVEETEHDGLRESGLFLAMSKPHKVFGVLAAIVGMVLLAVAGGNAVAAVVERTWFGLGALVVVGPLGVVALLFAYLILRGRRGVVPGLLVTPTRILFRDNAGEVFAIPWRDVSRIEARILKQGAGTYFNLIAIEADPTAEVWESVNPTLRRLARKRDDRALVKVQDKGLLMNPLIAYHLLRHYLANPEQRRDICRAAPVDQR